MKENKLENFATNETLLRRALDLAVKGMMIVNPEGIIVYVNRSFEKIHGIAFEDAVGKHVTNVIENTRMHLVAKTGIPERDEIQDIHGQNFVVSRVPIVHHGKTIGVLGMIRFEYTDELNRLNERINRLKGKLKEAVDRKNINQDTFYSFDDIVAVSELSKKAKEMAVIAAASESTVLLLGESGVGKEVYAHSIHNQSKRKNESFVRMNCSAIQETLLESELFGYEEGAFTGAKKGGKKGKFELANKGTILLDEIGDMPLPAQAKLLRVIQEREIDKIGGEKTTNIDVRIIASTNQDLQELVKKGKFRQDLYYRLNVIPIVIPPLRDRKEDIPELVKTIWERLKKKQGVYYKKLDYTAYEAFQRHNWVGNIRELNNVLERAMAVVMQDTINEEHIRTILIGSQNTGQEFCSQNNCNLTKLVSETEKSAISVALIRSENNRSQAAKLLGISRALLYKKMHLYNMFN